MKGYVPFARVISLVDCIVIFFSALLVAICKFALATLICARPPPV